MSDGLSGLTLPAISHVFAINYVAEMLGEDEEWLWELQMDVFADDGCPRVYGVGEDGGSAFTDMASSAPGATYTNPPGRKDECGTDPALGADRAEQIGRLCALVVDGARSRALAGPAVGQLVFLPDAHLVLKPHLY